MKCCFYQTCNIIATN